MSDDDLLSGLPAERIVRQGLSDLKAGRETVASILVRIAAPRLRSAGLLDPVSDAPREWERALYRLLRDEGGGDAYSRYNALLRELTSFEAALDRRLRVAASGNRTRSS